VQAINPKTIVEIGTARGGTLLIWSYLASRRVITCDLLDLALQRPLFSRFAPPGSNCQITLLSGNSHEASFKARLARELNGEKADFLFIDGDHTESGPSKRTTTTTRNSCARAASSRFMTSLKNNLYRPIRFTTSGNGSRSGRRTGIRCGPQSVRIRNRPAAFATGCPSNLGTLLHKNIDVASIPESPECFERVQ